VAEIELHARLPASWGALGVGCHPPALHGKDTTKDGLHVSDRTPMDGDAFSTKFGNNPADGGRSAIKKRFIVEELADDIVYSHPAVLVAFCYAYRRRR
jgi:hypothetical protein